MEMVSPSDQADALGAIALLETLGMVSTTSLFGIIFAKLSDEGLGMWIYVLNGVKTFLLQTELTELTLLIYSGCSSDRVQHCLLLLFYLGSGFHQSA